MIFPPLSWTTFDLRPDLNISQITKTPTHPLPRRNNSGERKDYLATCQKSCSLRSGRSIEMQLDPARIKPTQNVNTKMAQKATSD